MFQVSWCVVCPFAGHGAVGGAIPVACTRKHPKGPHPYGFGGTGERVMPRQCAHGIWTGKRVQYGYNRHPSAAPVHAECECECECK